MGMRIVVALSFLSAVATAAGPPQIFVSGDNHGASEARKTAAKCKCLRLVANRNAAEAILEVRVTEVKETLERQMSTDSRTIQTAPTTAVLYGMHWTVLWQGDSVWGGATVVRRLDSALCKGKLKIPR
jgi:hypothetical protein